MDTADTPPDGQSTDKVRPVGIDPPLSPRPPRLQTAGLATLLFVGFAGVGLGYLLGGTSSQGLAGSDIDPPDLATTQAPASGTAPSPDATLPPPPTPTTTTGPSASTTTRPPSLAAQIPALAGKVILATTETGALRWAAPWPEPVIIETDRDTYAIWDPTGAHFAFVDWQPNGQTGVLYVGAGSNRPIFLDAREPVWHATRPELAWLGTERGMDDFHLYRAAISRAGTAAVEQLTAIDIGFEDEFEWTWLQEWGDWGFVVNRGRYDPTGMTEESWMTVLDPAGVEVARASDLRLIHATNEGLLLVGTEVGHEGLDDPRWVDTALQTVAPFDGGGEVFDYRWSRDGSRYTANRITTSDSDPASWIDVFEADGTLVASIATNGWLAALSDDGTVIAVETSSGTRTALEVIDVDSGERATLRFTTWVWGIQIADM